MTKGHESARAKSAPGFATDRDSLACCATQAAVAHMDEAARPVGRVDGDHGPLVVGAVVDGHLGRVHAQLESEVVLAGRAGGGGMLSCGAPALRAPRHT